jgi:hypothetical protein
LSGTSADGAQVPRQWTHLSLGEGACGLREILGSVDHRLVANDEFDVAIPQRNREQLLALTWEVARRPDAAILLGGELELEPIGRD